MADLIRALTRERKDPEKRKGPEKREEQNLGRRARLKPYSLFFV